MYNVVPSCENWTKFLCVHYLLLLEMHMVYFHQTLPFCQNRKCPGLPVLHLVGEQRPVFVPRHGVFPVPVFGFRLSAGQGFAVPVGVEADGAELFLENTWGYHNREVCRGAVFLLATVRQYSGTCFMLTTEEYFLFTASFSILQLKKLVQHF